MKNKKIAIVGAGFSGAVIARELVEAGLNVDVFDQRSHIGGNCHTQRDDETGIMEHKYGPHIFHTSNVDVWNYIKRFGTIVPYINRVKAVHGQKIYSLPVNLSTINQLFEKNLSPLEAENFIKSKQHNIDVPQNFEEQALAFVGDEIYNTFFKGYTKKQWGLDPKELPASVLKRLPIRFNYDDNYYNSDYQGIPIDGYTAIVERILDKRGINLMLNARFSRSMQDHYAHIFFSGPLDEWFDHCFGELTYRTLEFKKELHEGDFQGNAVINYCDEEIPFTRISEHKHFSPWEKHRKTIIYKEYSKKREGDEIPYYPVRLANDKKQLGRYIGLAENQKHVTFVGRLGTYRYLDMHITIEEALKAAKNFIEDFSSGRPARSFYADLS